MVLVVKFRENYSAVMDKLDTVVLYVNKFRIYHSEKKFK